jgi:hypothetical protein
MKCDRETFFYMAYQDEVVLSARKGKRVDSSATPVLPEGFGVEATKQIFHQLGLTVPSFSDGDIQDVITLYRENKDPYAKHS